jgi:hypothetical protein
VLSAIIFVFHWFHHKNYIQIISNFIVFYCVFVFHDEYLLFQSISDISVFGSVSRLYNGDFSYATVAKVCMRYDIRGKIPPYFLYNNKEMDLFR